MNTADYLLSAAPDGQTALATNKSLHTYRELRQASARLVGELLALELHPGDRIGILGENSLFWVAAYLAILKLGIVAVPLPTVSTPEELNHKERFVECKAVCVDRRSYRRFASALDENLALIFDDILTKPGPSAWESLKPNLDLHQDAALMLTSGTTARPRAVRVTHRNIQANTDSIIEYLELDESERILSVLPFYYCFGTSLLHTHLRIGGSIALCNTFAYPETALDMLEEKECTAFAGVPSTYQTLLRNTSFPRRDLKTLRKVQQAGGKLPVVFIKELMEALPKAQIFVMYGQTEATARLSFLQPDLLKTRLGSIGKGIPGVVLRVLREGGEDVEPGEIGEIHAWGDNISPGYFNDPELSAGKFIKGALRTGDLATVDEDGFIYIVDRKADFIKSFGHRVSSQEVEAYILELPDVVAAAAVGVPDELQGEAIKVFVVLRQGTDLDAEMILSHCRKRMARHMIPKEIVVIDSLPTNAHGKVVKAMLREEAREVG
jgi:long-chain acyl-CoA synthetase